MNDRIVQAMILALLLVLPIAALSARRPPWRRTAIYGAAWAGVFLLLLVVLVFT